VDTLDAGKGAGIMTGLAAGQPGTREAGWQALGLLYHNFFTGLILSVASRAGHDLVGEWTYNLFRRQHTEKFLSSFEKLGLTGLPDAVAAARYHYLANRIGGVDVEYVEESDTKAWVRFPHPRWVYMGTAICGVPDSVEDGFVKGWYGHNGVSLGNPRLGFVCTSRDTHAEYGYAGYFMEYDHDLAADERARYAPGEVMPPFDAAKAPGLDGAIWTPDRLNKARRNYAMEYIRNGLFELTEMIGEAQTRELGEITARLIGRQFYPILRETLGHDTADTSLEAFGRFMADMAAAHDDTMEWRVQSGQLEISQQGWRLVRGLSDVPPTIFDSWNGFWEGCLNVHDRFRTLQTIEKPNGVDGRIVWHIK